MTQDFTNASVACVRGDSVLLVQRSWAESSFPGYWEFPGGNVEPGEAPIETARREFAEECGCGAAIGDAVATFSWWSHGHRKVEVVFNGRVTGTIRLDGDHCAYAWVRPDDLAEGRYLCSPEVKSVVLGLYCGAGSGPNGRP
jgi:8-oxo-dGTP diphosphatase